MVLQGYGAALLLAELHTPTARCKEDVVDRYARIRWEDASEEQRKSLTWVKEFQGDKTAHLPLTPQQKEQIKKNKQYHNEKIYEYLIRNYGWEYGEKFYNDEELTCEKILIKHCETKREKGQCNMFCPYFDKKCKED